MLVLRKTNKDMESYNNIINKTFKDSFAWIKSRIDESIEDAYNSLCVLVKENGGLIKTPAASDKATLYAVYEDAAFFNKTLQVAIHGIRYDEELGLTICTDDMLDNYQFDNYYSFQCYLDFEGEDLENLEKALADPAYFVEFDKYDLLRVPTILSILNGIGDYL